MNHTLKYKFTNKCLQNNNDNNNNTLINNNNKYTN